MTTAEPTRTDGSTVPATGARIRPSAPPRPVEPGAGLRARLRRHPVLLTALVAAVVHLVWFFFLANSGGDIAAQDAWAEFVGRHPDSAYNLAWYGGMHPSRTAWCRPI